MTDATAEAPEAPAKTSKLPMILSVLALFLGGGLGFYGTYSGLLFGAESHADAMEEATASYSPPDVSFVEVEPMVISLTSNQQGQHLRFRAQLEVPSRYASEVSGILPRVVDVLNGYLRALETRDIESPAALTRLRAQMLRRVQIVTGPGRVNDLLIMEFVLS
ncbi:MAG: flagellar basal body-associated FliL family protein [Pseudomonadota bacterium]